MAIRRPSIYSPTWIYQDFLYLDNPPEQLRYVVVKWDGAVYTRTSQTFDYSNPPYSNSEQKGGSIVARIDYTVNGKLVTIDSWEVNWRDEWPLRLAINYLVNCLYDPNKDYVIRVIKTPEDIAFWQSEDFKPITNLYDDYLVRFPLDNRTATLTTSESYSVSIEPNPAAPGDPLVIAVDTDNVPIGTQLYWKLSGPGVNPTFFQSGVMSGTIKVGS
jgi:hypothetical protein